MVHSWSVRAFLYQVPSFLLYYKLGKIIAIFFYMMAFALLESILVTAALVLLGFVLPLKWFREGFPYKAFLTVSVAAGAMIYLQSILDNKLPPKETFLLLGGISFAAVVLLILLAHNLKFLQKVLLFIVDRLSILLYLFLPLSTIGLVVVMIRNFW